MRKSLSHIHSPRNLVIFETAARLGSFTKAAESLHMQQPSVSAAIKQLEEALGVQLFYRGHRKVDLTSAGERLFSGVTRGLNEIEASINAVRQIGQSTHVTLNASSAFSYYWMIPKMADLHARHPDVDLRLQSSDREPDLDAEGISLGIRLGNGNWADCHATLIAEEIIYPVASPQVMAAAYNLHGIADLLDKRLIHLEEPVRQRPSWAQWFSYHNVRHAEIQAGLRLNDYALVLQAAVSGEGFAFGWDHVVRNLVTRGLLEARKEWSWNTGNGFYVVWSKNRPLSAQAAKVRDWIVSVSDFPHGQ